MTRPSVARFHSTYRLEGGADGTRRLHALRPWPCPPSAPASRLRHQQVPARRTVRDPPAMAGTPTPEPPPAAPTDDPTLRASPRDREYAVMGNQPETSAELAARRAAGRPAAPARPPARGCACRRVVSRAPGAASPGPRVAPRPPARVRRSGWSRSPRRASSLPVDREVGRLAACPARCRRRRARLPRGARPRAARPRPRGPARAPGRVGGRLVPPARPRARVSLRAAPWRGGPPAPRSRRPPVSSRRLRARA